MATMSCPECRNEYSEARVEVVLTCCSARLCRRCAFKNYIEHKHYCWNYYCWNYYRLR